MSCDIADIASPTSPIADITDFADFADFADIAIDKGIHMMLYGLGDELPVLERLS